MNEILGKISSYHLFNYLFCGALFAILAEALTKYSFAQENIVLAIFLYYFIGLVLSRIGSLFIEPLLRKFSFVNAAAEYSDYVRVEKIDPKLEVLSEASNMYRTLVSVCAGLMFLKFYEVFRDWWGGSEETNTYLLLLLLLVIFLLAYRKQSGYISKRIKANTKNHE